MKKERFAAGRSQLVLMCQIIMVLFFAAASAICVRVFVFSSVSSAGSAGLDRAVVLVESAAETCKSCGGDMEQAAGRLGGRVENGALTVSFDENWEPEPEGDYTLSLTPLETASPLLGEARVTASGADGEEIFSVTAAWQKEAPDE